MDYYQCSESASFTFLPNRRQTFTLYVQFETNLAILPYFNLFALSPKNLNLKYEFSMNPNNFAVYSNGSPFLPKNARCFQLTRMTSLRFFLEFLIFCFRYQLFRYRFIIKNDAEEKLTTLNLYQRAYSESSKFAEEVRKNCFF